MSSGDVAFMASSLDPSSGLTRANGDSDVAMAPFYTIKAGTFDSARGRSSARKRPGWYGRSMKDRRLQDYRVALDVLVESLDAVVRVARWTGAEAPPEPLQTAVEKLPERRATAERLVRVPFSGSRGDADSVTALCSSMKKLDDAYLAYRTRLTEGDVSAASDLEHDISEATAS